MGGWVVMFVVVVVVIVVVLLLVLLLSDAPKSQYNLTPLGIRPLSMLRKPLLLLG